MAKEDGAVSVVDFGPGYAKVTTWLEEKVGLQNYSNVTYGTSVTRFCGDADENVEATIKANEQVVEGWMKDYFRREVEDLLGSKR